MEGGILLFALALFILDSMPEILYEDEFITLKEDYLVIKRYFFPMMKPKIVPVRAIRILYFDEQNNGKFNCIRTWGKTEKNVYWAVDFRRCLPGDKHGKNNVIIDIEDGVRKGFTVNDVQTFLEALRVVAPMSLICIDNLDI